MKNAENLQLDMRNPDDVTAIILAGGLGTRLNNENKGLITLGELTLVEHIIKRLNTQTQHIVINANKDLSRYQATGYPVIKDRLANYQGPLAGILSCQFSIKTPLVLTVPCDTPLLPENLLEKMLRVYNNNLTPLLCVVHDGQRQQNLFMLFNAEHMNHLGVFFRAHHRKVADWINSQEHAIVDFSEEHSGFININTETTLNALRKKL